MSIVTLLDQIIDAVGVFFYLLFWGGNNKWINVDPEETLMIYDITWELGTTTQPYLLMIICPEVRKAFFKLYKANFVHLRVSLVNFLRNIQSLLFG